MKNFILLFFLFTATIEASYCRSIRVQSFSTQDRAENSLKIFKEFANSNDIISKLQKKLYFQYKITKVGKYYMLTVEPITDKKSVQKLLDTIRTKYPKAYPKKIKPPIQKKTKSNTIKEPQKKQLKHKVQTKEIKKEHVKKTAKPVVHNYKHNYKTENKIIKTTTKENNFIYIYILIILILLLSLLLMSKIILNLKRQNKVQDIKDAVNLEHIKQLKLDLNNKDKVLSNATHELRTPMTAIISLIHMFLESELSVEQKDYIQHIESSSDNMLKIINDILDISKIQAGKLNLEHVEFNINDVMEYVLNTVSIKAKNNNISISMDIDYDVPSYVVGDSFRLGQVLINLLSNAVKFTKNGEVSLKVKKILDHDENVKLKFIVSDSGIGMTKSQMQNLFQSYHQATASTTREFGGTGLGLSISKELVELMDGEIDVKSQKDIGSTFTFSINFKLKDLKNKRQYRLPSASMLHKKILIVDDSNKNVISLMKFFGYFNYKIHTIRSFEKDTLKSNMIFDIVVINQTKLSTIAINKIKEIQLKYSSKLVVLSELYSTINDKSLQGIKINSYLKNPFTQHTVLNMISELYSTKDKEVGIKERLKDLSGKKILVAEDNKLNHKVIFSLLSHTDIELVFVEDGKNVLELLDNGIKFDMILMDINMPVLGGYEATQEIRKNKNYDDIPILALSADATDKAMQRAVISGMQGYLLKPIEVDIFYKNIFDILSKTEDDSLFAVEDKNDDFKELSISLCLKKCNDDEDFYKLILEDFKKMYKDSEQRFEKLCINSEFKEAKQMAMDVRDVALNIGAYHLYKSAANMEQVFSRGFADNWQELLKDYSLNLKNLFKDIDKYLSIK